MAVFNLLKYKRDLKNAQHFAFIQAFITALQEASFSSPRITAKLAELTAAFSTEDLYYMQARASQIVAQREAADRQRDSYYTRLHRLVLAWAGSGMQGLDEAATALIRPFELYKVKINAQMDEETGVLENLISDLSTTQMQAHITTINGAFFFQQMVAGQNLVKSLRLEQGVEESQKVYGALAAARKACDTLYDDICDIIEGASLFADDPSPFDTFIRQWNGTVKLYQDMLDRKQGSDSSASGSGGSSSGSGSTGTNTDSGSGSGTGDASAGGDSTESGGSSSGSGDAGGSDDTGSTGDTGGSGSGSESGGGGNDDPDNGME